ncbi:hypothetical protein WDW86_08375 [Bdellovibrionota bacterium FG-2]
MKKITHVVLCLALVALSGCRDFSSPAAVLASAYAAIQGNNVTVFVSTLAPNSNAQIHYGDGKGMKALKSELAGYDVVFGNPALTDKQIVTDDNSCLGPSPIGYTGPRIYETSVTEILGKKTGASEYSIIKRATTSCTYCLRALEPINGHKVFCQISELD